MSKPPKNGLINPFVVVSALVSKQKKLINSHPESLLNRIMKSKRYAALRVVSHLV
jgi:hypothetical protein